LHIDLDLRHGGFKLGHLRPISPPRESHCARVPTFDPAISPTRVAPSGVVREEASSLSFPNSYLTSMHVRPTFRAILPHSRLPFPTMPCHPQNPMGFPLKSGRLSRRDTACQPRRREQRGLQGCRAAGLQSSGPCGPAGLVCGRNMGCACLRPVDSP
jgi:hypothetical protein